LLWLALAGNDIGHRRRVYHISWRRVRNLLADRRSVANIACCRQSSAVSMSFTRSHDRTTSAANGQIFGDFLANILRLCPHVRRSDCSP